MTEKKEKKENTAVKILRMVALYGVLALLAAIIIMAFIRR